MQRRQLPDIGMLFLNITIRRSHLVSDSLNEVGTTEELYKLELRPILPAVTPLALLALWLAFPAVTPQHCYDAPLTNGNAPRAPAAGLACKVSSLYQQTRRNLKNVNTKKITPIHENADTNITCDFGDGDISRSGVAYLTQAIHTQIDR